MRELSAPIFLVLMTMVLSSCDIEPVSTGTWDIEVETASGIEDFVWTISSDGTVRMSGNSNHVAENAVLAGSRISWSGESLSPENPSQTISTNFNGTVDGDRLQGTLFTTLGNMTVSGNRQ